MRTPQELERGLAAPETLGLEPEWRFAKRPSSSSSELPESAPGRLVIDLSATRRSTPPGSAP